MVQHMIKIPVEDDVNLVLKTKDYKIEVTDLSPEGARRLLQLGFAAAIGRGETAFAKKLRAAGLDEKKVAARIRARRRGFIKEWTGAPVKVREGGGAAAPPNPKQRP
jgi:hypothetical protein